jgi:hypothetical protein
MNNPPLNNKATKKDLEKKGIKSTEFLRELIQRIPGVEPS